MWIVIETKINDTTLELPVGQKTKQIESNFYSYIIIIRS